MLNPKIPANVITQNPIIAGGSAGIPIHCSPQARPHYDEILKLAKSGHHWARLAVSGISALTSGKLKNHVFVQEDTNLKNGSNVSDVFYAVLPGIKATFEHRSNGTYNLTSLIPDKNYMKMLYDAEKPALYEVKKPSNRWIANLIENGEVKKDKEFPFVVITDRNHQNIDDAAEQASSSLSDAPAASSDRILKAKGFNMHFTPGTKRISGLKSINVGIESKNDRHLHQSAIQLANSMYNAKDTEGVLWLSEYGGSGVLQKAMEILSTQEISLKKHAIFLSHPTTPPSELFKLSSKLGLETEGRGITKGLGRGEFWGRMSIIDTPKSKITRLKHDENYDGYKLTGDVIRGVNELGSSPVGGMIGADKVFGIIGGMNLFFKNVFPKAHKKITNRF